jgi:hypothetical protein
MPTVMPTRATFSASGRTPADNWIGRQINNDAARRHLAHNRTQTRAGDF